MSASVLAEIGMCAALIVAFGIVVGGALLVNWVEKRRMDRTTSSPSMCWPVGGYTEPERRETNRTVDYRRPAKVCRFPDVYDHREDVDA